MEKLIALSGLAQTLYGRWRFNRLLSGMFILAVLAIICAFMVNTLLMGSFYAIYIALLHFGIDQQNAIFIVLSLFALSAALFTFVTSICLHKKLQSTTTSRVYEVVDAFMDGFNNGR